MFEVEATVQGRYANEQLDHRGAAFEAREHRTAHVGYGKANFD